MYEHYFKSFNASTKSRLRKSSVPFWVLEGSLSPSRVDRSPSNHRRTGKEEKRTTGVCYSKMPLSLQRHPWKDGDEKPQSKTQWRQHMEQMSRIKEHAILRNQRIPNRRPRKDPMATEGFWEDDVVKEKVVIRDDHLDQPIIINGKLSIECKQKLGEVLWKNVDVFAWTQIARIVRKVQYPGWVANAMPIKIRDDTWKIHLEYSRLNKVCVKDMYPFPEVEEKPRSLVGHQYKCFLRLLKEAVIKSKLEQDLIEDVEETLYKLQRLNIKLDPSKCTFRMEEGKFLGYMATTEGIKADPKKRLYIGRDPSKEGSGVGMILVDPMEREYSHAICLNFQASEGDMDYEALLAGLVASAGQGMKDLHVFVDSRLLVDQVEGNKIPRIEEAKRYMENIMDVTTPFHMFWIAHLPKALNPKAEALTGLASIQLEFLN
ncbi:reverse transcriptase domain-containing protein [Tanacetum coccineum]